MSVILNIMNIHLTKKIDDFIARIDKIPKKEILLVKDTYRQSTKQETNFSKKITTKKDFEKWKKEIKKMENFIMEIAYLKTIYRK